MKKIIILLFIFLICGCSTVNDNFINDIDYNIVKVLTHKETHSNVSGKGFKYYKPRDFALLEDNDFNHILSHNSNKYYLNVDINAYRTKTQINLEKSEEDYYSNEINYDNLSGFIQIKKGENDYFYIKMLYNYSYIEVSVKKYEIEDAIIDCAIILSSIKYNDSVINNIIGNKDVDSRENAYEIKKPKEEQETRNILNVYEYDTFTNQGN